MRKDCAGAIGTAEFAGARLCDVLAYAGLSYEDGFGEACARQPHSLALPVCHMGWYHFSGLRSWQF